MTKYSSDLSPNILPTWRLFPDANVLADQATQDILKAASTSIEKTGAFHIVLAGGTTPKQIYKQLAESKSDWQNWHIYLGDERCLAIDDSERNSVMINECLLQKVSIPRAQIHFIPAELGPNQAAAVYQTVLNQVKAFDMVLLGMGEDGHTASLFPGHSHNQSLTVHPVTNAPKPPAERVSISSASLSNNEHLLIFITGKSKHNRVIDWISRVLMPVTTIKSTKKAAVYCDHAAWLGDT